MSARVDVLAMMDEAEMSLIGARKNCEISDAAGLRQAFEAVADLINSNERVIRALEALGRANKFVDDARARKECEAAMVALKDALSRIGATK